MPIWILYKKRKFMEGTSDFSKGREKTSSPIIEKDKKGIRKFQTFLVVFLILFLPLVNLSTSSLSDRTMAKDYLVHGIFSRSTYDPVDYKVGPSFDTSYVIEEMEEAENREWHLEDIRDQIDLDEITKVPGRLGAYYLTKRFGGGTRASYIVITYTYISPLPITRTFGFRIYDSDGGKEAVLGVEDTIMYPMNPSRTDPF